MLRQEVKVLDELGLSHDDQYPSAHHREAHGLGEYVARTDLRTIEHAEIEVALLLGDQRVQQELRQSVDVQRLLTG